MLLSLDYEKAKICMWLPHNILLSSKVSHQFIKYAYQIYFSFSL